MSEKDLEKAYNMDYDVKIILDYGIKLLELGKLGNALVLYDFYFDSEDNSRKEEVEKYFITLAKECSKKNKNRDAIKCCDYYLDKESTSVNVLKLKIELLSHLKRFDDALICYDKLIGIVDDKEQYDPCVDQIICLEAKAFYQYDKGLLNDSINTLTIASEYYSDYNLYVYNLNSWHEHLKNTLYKYASQEDEFFDNLLMVDTEDSMEWCGLIGYFTNNLYSYGNIDLMICDWLLEKYPESIPILNKKAGLYLTWKPTHSLKLYEKVLEIEEYNLDAIRWKLIAYIKLKRYGKLREYIQSLSNNIDGISDVLSYIGSNLIKVNKYPEAIMCYEKILEINPNNIDAITQIKRIWDKAGMKEEKNNSKYYMDWIKVILSRNDWYNCPNEDCYERLYHIVHGLKGHILIENPRNAPYELYVRGSIDCDEDSTHYCPKCKKEYKLGVECFNYNMEDPVLYNYATTLILAVKHYIYHDSYIGVNLDYLAERLHEDYNLDKREFNALINKLEKLDYLTRKVELNSF